MADFINVIPLPAPLLSSFRELWRGGSASWPAEASEADHRDLLTALNPHAMAPLVYQRVVAGDARWPRPVMEALRAASLEAAVVEPLRLADMQTLFEAFAGQGIDVLLFKGSALAYQIFDAPEHRPRADSDLLVAERQRERAICLLTGLGYEGRITSGDPLANRQQSFSRIDSFGVEHVYDLHWNITNTPVVRQTLSFEELLARAVVVPAISSLAVAPSLVDALLLACVHRVVHHHDSERLIWLYDIHLLLAALSFPERARFRDLAIERKVSAICARSISLAAEWFGSAEEARHLFAPAAGEAEPSAKFLDRHRSGAAVLREDLRALPWSFRARRIRDLAFPPAAFMRSRFPSSPRLLLPLLYLYRGVRGVWRLVQPAGGAANGAHGRMKNRWQRFFDAPRAERLAFLRAVRFLIATRIVMTTRGFAFACKLADQRRARLDGPGDAERSALLARSVERVSRHIGVEWTCLERSIALCWMLSAERLGGSLRVGVKTASGSLSAHAWVERDGRPLFEEAGGDFAPFDAGLLGDAP